MKQKLLIVLAFWFPEWAEKHSWGVISDLHFWRRMGIESLSPLSFMPLQPIRSISFILHASPSAQVQDGRDVGFVGGVSPWSARPKWQEPLVFPPLSRLGVLLPWCVLHHIDSIHPHLLSIICPTSGIVMFGAMTLFKRRIELDGNLIHVCLSVLSTGISKAFNLK